MKKLLFVFSALVLLAVGYGLFRWTFKQTTIQTQDPVAQKTNPASAVLVTDNNTATLTQVAQPAIYPNGGEVLTKDQITLSSATTGAVIYYTIDGTTPTTSSYLYNGFVDLQPGNTYFNIGTYVVQTMAVKSGYSNSDIARASFNVTNQDKIQRKILSDQQISINHDDCWTAAKKKCTSLFGMLPATLNEIGYFAQACDAWNNPTGQYANGCEVKVTAGTEDGHSGTGVCSHIGGSKFDMSPVTNVTNYIQTSGQFTKLANVIIKGVSVVQYKWKSGGAIYTYEKNIPDQGDHWDVLIGGCQ